jgi:hypothetical protein
VSEDTITEAASENQPKPKRGRPSKWVEGAKRHVDSLDRGITTDRGRTNHIHAENGLIALAGGEGRPPDAVMKWPDRYRWIVGRFPETVVSPKAASLIRAASSALKMTASQDAKVSILSELGRITSVYGDETARSVADQLSEMKPRPTVKAAVAMLRRWRLPKTKPGRVDGLVDAITRAIDLYCDQHPETEPEMIDDALGWVSGIYCPCDEDEDEAPDPADAQAET